MSTKIKVCKAHAAKLETLQRAFRDDAVCLIEVQMVETGEVHACLATVTQDGEESIITPFCIFLNGDPYAQLRPPNPEGGFLEEDK